MVFNCLVLRKKAIATLATKLKYDTFIATKSHSIKEM